MDTATRNLIVFLGVATAWVFFFVPNPWLSFIEAPGNERFPKAVYLSLPAVLAAISVFAMAGQVRTRVGLALCLPLLHFVLFQFSLAGWYANEELLGIWLMFLLATPVYLGGVAVAALVSTIVSRAAMENVAVIATLIVISFVLLWISFRLVPLQAMLIVDLVAMPLLLGLAAGYLLVGDLRLKLALLVLIPVAHLLIMGGRDDARPGLGHVVMLAELGAIWVGCLAGAMVRRRTHAAKATPRSRSSLPPLTGGRT